MNLDKIFHLKENHTDVKTEVMAGITTFMTMAYILAVNPNILVCFRHGQRCCLYRNRTVRIYLQPACMALLWPTTRSFWLPAWALNAYFTYTVVLRYGILHGSMALAAVFAEGIIFILTFSYKCT